MPHRNYVKREVKSGDSKKSAKGLNTAEKAGIRTSVITATINQETSTAASIIQETLEVTEVNW